MITELFKRLCHDKPQQVPQEQEQEGRAERPERVRMERLTHSQISALKAYRIAQEETEQRERAYHEWKTANDDFCLFVHLVQNAKRKRA